MRKGILRTFLFLLMVVFLISGCDTSTEPEEIEDPTGYTDYEEIWSEDFDQADSTLDDSKWVFETGYGENDSGWGNDEWQLYTSDNVRLENGNLVITAAWDSLNYPEPGKRDGSVTSARITTQNKFSVKYGKVEARIKAPVDMGMWPAFWMLGSSFETIGWPRCGEIDIMEMSPLYHNSGTTMFTLHWWDDDIEAHASDGSFKEFSYSLGDDFHVYEVEWDAQRVVGRIDGITYYTKVLDSVLMNEFMREFFIILNVAVGGNLGGTPDATTNWDQEMLVDWVRVYQREGTDEVLSSYGIFTDETEVDDELMIGVDSQIYFWTTNTGAITLSAGSIPPYEGDNVISCITEGAGWFGAGISSNVPWDLSEFAYGYMNFMIKIPANVSFKIGINDIAGNENYVEFPADQTVYGLLRDGEWGKAMIPIEELSGEVDLSALSYEFIILEENGTQCQFAIDDIYWSGGGITPGLISFDQEFYLENATNAQITITDAGAAGTTKVVTVDNGVETISLDIVLDNSGSGTGTINFGITDDATDTIEIIADGSLTSSYIDSNAILRSTEVEIVGLVPGTINFGQATYLEDATSAQIMITDVGAAGTTKVVTVENGVETISLDIVLDNSGSGSGTVNFGITDDATDTIEITEGGTITASFTDSGGNVRSDSAEIVSDQTPMVSAPDPSHNSANVISVYSDSYTDIPGTDFDPDWGQTTVVTVENIGGNEMLKYDVFNYQGTELASPQDLSGMEYLHVDMWTNDATVVEVTPVSQSSGEFLVSLSPITLSTWNSYEIALGDFTGVSMSDIFQLKFDCQGGLTPCTVYLDNIYFYSSDSDTETMGIYSETHIDPMFSYTQIINSANWSANGASPDEQSTAVAPVDGGYVLDVEFTDLGYFWGGIIFECSSNPQDISSYNTLIINIDKQMMPTLTQFEIKFVDNTGEDFINISDYPAQSAGNWEKYEIPFSDFPTVDFSKITQFLLANPMNSSNELIFGNLYFDDIYLENK